MAGVSEAADLILEHEFYPPSAPLTQSFKTESSSDTELIESQPIAFREPEAATPDAVHLQAFNRRQLKRAAPARIAIMVLVFVLVGPSSITLKRSVAAKDHSAPEQFYGSTLSLYQPALAETSAAPPPPGPRPAFSEAKSKVFVQTNDRSWIVGCADGKVLFSKLFTAGNRHTFEFNRRAIVRVGSAGSVRIVVDGESPGELGAVGQVRIIEFTPGDSHFLKGGEIEDCTKGR